MASAADPREVVSVIIPARDAAATIGRCLDALERQDFPRERFEVIVVDDGSIDATARLAEASGARTLRIAPSGPAAARNRGVEAAHGGILLFTDADCAPDPGWIRALVEALADPGVAAAKGTYRTEQTSATARFVQREYESRYRRMAGRESIDFIDTYSAAYRRDAFERAGGFDESFPSASVEDQELGFRLWALGARMVFCPGAVVLHRHAATPLAYFRKKMKIAFWKSRVIARYPAKAVTDSHTPGTLKAEVALVGAAVLAGPAGAAAGAAWLPLPFLAAFAACGAPFCADLARRDPSLALRAPLFLFLRAFGLGCGAAAGLCWRAFGRRADERRMERPPERAPVPAPAPPGEGPAESLELERATAGP